MGSLLLFSCADGFDVYCFSNTISFDVHVLQVSDTMYGYV